ncbi:MAG: hypothetical protein QOK37_4688 [Thermoanaerobaculia bacterium]|jgi:hypothetical protein|nr:hypothetical protein [Thermoanaerobaculia bacterium]
MTSRRQIVCVVFALAFLPSLYADDLLEKRDTAIEMNASVWSVAVFKNVLYASTATGRIYRWDSSVGEWDPMPTPEQWGNSLFGNENIRLRVLNGRLIAISGRLISASHIYEWSEQYWKQLGYVETRDLYDVFAAADGSLYGLAEGSLLKLASTGEWERVWPFQRDDTYEMSNNTAAVGFIAARPVVIACRYDTHKCECVDVIAKSYFGLALDGAQADAHAASVGDAMYFTLFRTVRDSISQIHSENLNRIARWDGKSLTFLTTPVPAQRVFAFDSTLYIGTEQAILRLGRDGWEATGLPGDVFSLARFDGTLVAATSAGVLQESSPGKWHSLGAIESTVNDVLTRGKERLYATGRDVYSTVHGSLHVPVMDWSSTVDGKPGEATNKLCTRLVSVSGGVYSICAGQLSYLPDSGNWKSIPFRKGESTNDLFRNGEHLYAATTYGIHRASGGVFRSLGQLGQKSNVVVVVHDRVFAGTDKGLFVFDAKTNEWHPLPDLVNVKVTTFSNLVNGADYAYLGTSNGEIWRFDSAAATRFSDKFQSTTDPSILSIWFRKGVPQPSHDVLVVGTKDALFWSNDGGSRWNRATKLTSVNRILDLGGRELAIAALEGPYTIAERIPSEWWPRVRNTVQVFTGKWWWAEGIVLTVILFFPTPLTLRLIQGMPDGVKNAYFLSLFIAPVARRRLLSRYTSYLRRSRVVPTLGGAITLKEAVERYVSLPHKPDLGTDTPAAVLKLMEKNTVTWVRGGAGLGKSLLLWQIAWLLLAKKKVPIVLDGYSWHGEIGEQITAALRRGGAPVTQEVVDQLIEANAFTILIDGFSEIRMPYRDTAADKLNDFRADRSLVITSRQPPPEGPLALVAVDVELLPLDSHEALVPFLKKYLRNNDIKAATLRDAIEKQLRLTPEQWTPLMLAMIAATYEATGDVPDNRSHAYRQYFDRLVRREAIGDLSPASVKFALERLTRETFLKTDGDRGFAETTALTVFSKLLEEMKKIYGMDANASRLLETIESAGILVRSSSRRLRYFHDSFESFVAARYLQDQLAQKQFEEIRTVAVRRNANLGLSETWSFLADLLEERRDLEILEEIARSATAAA